MSTEQITEEEYLKREARINQSYRDGMISLEQKNASLSRLADRWENQEWETKHE